MIMNLIRQNDKKLKPEIRYDGCYFMCILNIYQDTARIELSPSDINTIYVRSVYHKYITHDCYILDNGFSGLFEIIAGITNKDLKCFYLGKKSEVGFDIPTHYIALYKRPLGRKTYYHFVVSDSRGGILFDPIYHSKTVEFGELKDIRCFEVKK